MQPKYSETFFLIHRTNCLGAQDQESSFVLGHYKRLNQKNEHISLKSNRQKTAQDMRQRRRKQYNKKKEKAREDKKDQTYKTERDRT